MSDFFAWIKESALQLVSWLPKDDALLNVTTEALGVLVSVPISVLVAIRIERGFQRKRARTRVKFILKRTNFAWLLTFESPVKVGDDNELKDKEFDTEYWSDAEGALQEFVNSIFTHRRHLDEAHDYIDENFINQFHDYDRASDSKIFDLHEIIRHQLRILNSFNYFLSKHEQGPIEKEELWDAMQSDFVNLVRISNKHANLISVNQPNPSTNGQSKDVVIRAEKHWHRNFRLIKYFVFALPKDTRKQIWEDRYWQYRGFDPRKRLIEQKNHTK